MFGLISVNTQEKPPRVFISRLKQEEMRKEKQGDKRQYRRVKKWELMELRIVDGRSQDTEVGAWSTNSCKGVWLMDDQLWYSLLSISYYYFLFSLLNKFVVINNFLHILHVRLPWRWRSFDRAVFSRLRFPNSTCISRRGRSNGWPVL